MRVGEINTHSDVTQEIMELLKVLPEEKQRLILQQAEAMAKEEKKRPIWDRIRAHAADIPDEDWEKMPKDGSEQHDHYLYGAPK